MMNSFTIRVELHGAVDAHYVLLHERLDAIGCKRHLIGKLADGTTAYWSLPTAEYDYSGTETAIAVRDRVKLIADSIKPGAWVLVTKVDTRAWSTRRIKVNPA